MQKTSELKYFLKRIEQIKYGSIVSFTLPDNMNYVINVEGFLTPELILRNFEEFNSNKRTPDAYDSLFKIIPF